MLSQLSYIPTGYARRSAEQYFARVRAVCQSKVFAGGEKAIDGHTRMPQHGSTRAPPRRGAVRHPNVSQTTSGTVTMLAARVETVMPAA